MTGLLPEDIETGVRIRLGETHLTRDLIVGFAAKFDPQPFHLDEEAGRQSLFKGLAASGWQLCALWMGHYVRWREGIIQSYPDPEGVRARLGPSPGQRNIRWMKPALMGDTLTFYATRTAVEDWKKPGWALTTVLSEIVNQRGETACSFEGLGLVRKRQDP
ncbi:MaoC/PaaZ C-terminal domain-containing protein [Futiania mangrovi]|uniref:MaoC family dehydratase N-terminal domain-containing protein n=1 Tax=Futiania mangrovi TaxID=2959716 RepID=A0A9J6PI61_9PROT|nr:MaoC/PaaZ C-terminal domain-containing protein [Futiania mangrovii]MCP1337491.1 MaoC family dehydratase N-terminal domain-containing protein [Futiania mangrovii]